MKVLVWQWGRRGAGPLVAAAIAKALADLPGVEVLLSLSTGAELLSLPGAPPNTVPVRTYQGWPSFVSRLLTTPRLVSELQALVRERQVDVALCAMPAPLDFAMAAALRRARVPFAVVVHDAHLHPGDRFPMQIALQRNLVDAADLVFALSTHVTGQLRARGLKPGQPLIQVSLPPFVFGPPPPPVLAHRGRVRLLSFGRLMPYKGLELLAEAMTLLGPREDLELRVVGSGPETAELARLRALPHVTVENRWVPEAELNALLGWSDALVLTHREASQSGVAAAAIAARRWVVSTRVGGLAEQLEDQPATVLCAPEAGSIAAAIATLIERIAPVPPLVIDWTPTATRVIEGLRELVPAPAHPPRTMTGEAHSASA